jgi:hypothetical protein
MINTTVRRYYSTNILLLLLLVITHLYSLFVFGATYWVDALAYVRLAHALKISNGLADYYRSDGYLYAAHVQPALPILWLLISQFPVHWQWPILAIFQHAIAVAALYVAFTTVNRYWPTRWHLFFCALLCVLPFYQSFHNELLTESLSSSLLIVGVSLLVSLLVDINFRPTTFVSLLGIMIIVTQLRSYFGPLFILLILLVLRQKRLLLSKYTAFLAFAAAIAGLSFPLYRAALIGDFFLPHVGGLANLGLSSFADPQPAASIAKAWSHIPMPPDLHYSKIAASGLTWSEIEMLHGYWKAIGLTRDDVERQAQSICALYQRDHHFLVRQRFALGIVSIGFVTPLLAGDANNLLFVNYSSRAFAKHCIDDGYTWHARIGSTDYRQTFGAFFRQSNFEDSDLPGADAARIAFADACEPYLTDLNLRFRDPCYLGTLLPDVWALAGIVSMIIVFVHSRSLGLLLLACPILNFVVLAYSLAGGLRYSYELFPIYLLACSMALGICLNRHIKLGFASRRD